MPWLTLQKCEPGWGYDCRTGLIIPINYVKHLEIESGFKADVFTKNYELETFSTIFDDESTTSSIFNHWIINDNPNFFKTLDFFFPSHEISAFISNVCLLNKTIEAEKSDNYPPEATHFVEKVGYGMQMLIIFDKKNSYLFEDDENGHFLDNIWENGEELTREQESVVCSVLIFAKNPEETTVKQMTIKEILQMRHDFNGGKCPEFESPLLCELSQLCEDENYPELSTKSIESTMGLFSLIFIVQKCLENENGFFELKEMLKMEESDEEIKEMLNLLKKLITKFWPPDISENPKTKSIDIPQDSLKSSKLFYPGNSCDDKSNKTFNEKEQQTDGIFEDLNELDSQTIILDKNSFYSMKPKILQCLKMKIMLLNDVDEPQIWDDSESTKVSVGFAVNRGKFMQETTDSSKIFISACPQKCTNDDRQWICINCGEFFKVNGFEVICNCGTTHVSNLNYECCDPKHPTTFSLWRRYEHIASFLNRKTNNVLDQMLESVKQQLNKHAEVENSSQDPGSEIENKFPALFFDKLSIYFLKMETIQQLKMPIILSNDMEKPYVWNKDFSKKMLLGFVSHANQPTPETIETKKMFVMRCPKRCSNDDRQWICIKCGNFFKTKKHDVLCDCGVDNINTLIFECFEPTHPKTLTISRTLPLLANFTDEQKSVLNGIEEEKIDKEDGMTADDQLSSVIQSIDNDDESNLDEIEILDSNNLAGDSVDLTESQNFANF